MTSLSVVFGVGKDIVERLKNLPVLNRMEFILGRSDNDYFNDHFISIGETDQNWMRLFEFLVHKEKALLNDLYSGEILSDPNEKTMVILEQEDLTRKLYNYLMNLNKREEALCYLEFFDQYDNETLELDEFCYYIDSIKVVCEETLMNEGSLLFCVDMDEFPNDI